SRAFQSFPTRRSSDLDLSHRIRLDLGNGYVGHRELMEAAPHSMILRIDAAKGGVEKLYEANRFITHINASPTEPWLITFCHEGRSEEHTSELQSRENL